MGGGGGPEVPALLLADGRVRLDVSGQRVVRDGVAQPVQPVVFRFLAYLAQHPDRVVSRTELGRGVWEGAHVVPDAMSQVARKARRALGDDAGEPRWLQAVARSGYRLVGPVVRDREPGAAPARPLVGRGDLVERVAAEVGRREWITLVGPPGVGKSRVAAAALGGSGVRVDLDDVGAPEEVEDRVRRALELVPTAPVARALAARGATPIWLDDVDHPDVVGSVVAAWRSPASRWVCTARQPVGIPGELVIEVPGLSAAAAAELWRTLAPGVPVPDLDSLDGLPVAIEIAAAHREVVGRDLAGAVLELGAPAGRDALDRVIGQTVASLGPEDRDALATLSAVASSFDPDTARLLGVGAASLAALRRRCLLRTDGVRLRVWSVVRAWCRRSLPREAGPAGIWQRLDDALCDGILLPDDLPLAIDRALAAGDADRAFRLAVRLDRRSGRSPRHASRLQDALALQSAPERRSRLRSRLADRLPPSAAIPIADLALVEAGADALARAEAHQASARAWLQAGDPVRAGREADAACADLPPGSVAHARALVTRAHAAWATGEIDRSLALNASAAGVFDAAGDARGAAIARANLAMAMLVRGQLGEAEVWFGRSREIRERSGDGVGLAHSAVNEAVLHRARGRIDAAARRFAEGAGLHHRHGAFGDEVNAIVGLALLRLDVDGADVGAALEEARTAVVDPTGRGPRAAEVLQGAWLASRGRWQDVLAALPNPAPGFDEEVDRRLLRAEARAAQGDVPGALGELDHAAPGSFGTAVRAARALLLARDGHRDEARSLVADLETPPVEAPGDGWESRLAIARVRQALGDPGADAVVASIAATVGLAPGGVALRRWDRAGG